MKFLSAQLDNDYNLWQLQVQMFNFKKFGIEDKAIVLIGFNPEIGVSQKALDFKEITTANVIFLPDTRDLSDRLYTPSIRPHLIKQLYIKYPDMLENRAVLYHDCDILFIKLPHVKELITKRKIYVSDIGEYLINHIDIQLLKDMCKIVGIPSSMVLKNEKATGGAQYLFNSSLNFSYDFWNKIEEDSNNIYKLMLVSVEKYGPTIVNQSWSADIWAILWNIWLLGVDTEVSEELSFTVGTTPIGELENNNIYHNSGVTMEMATSLFYKRDFTEKSPFEIDLSYVSKDFCSNFYATEIKEAAAYYQSKK